MKRQQLPKYEKECVQHLKEENHIRSKENLGFNKTRQEQPANPQEIPPPRRRAGKHRKMKLVVIGDCRFPTVHQNPESGPGFTEATSNKKS